MKINAIDAQFPSRVITREETLSLIEHYSKDTYQGNLDLALRTVSRLLHISGASTRRWLAGGEKPIDFIIQAIKNALKKSDLEKEDIDLIIYTGVGRGFLEPGNGYLVARAMGMNDVECFDVLDACMSFTRSLNMAENYLKNEQYENILIVNGEFNNLEGSILYPENYKLTSIEQVEYTFPTYTVGDVATATIVTNDPNKTWEWKFKSRADWSDLCTAPISGFEGYTVDTDRVGKNGVGNFCSFGNLMHEYGGQEIMKPFQSLETDVDKVAKIFPHASSKSAWAHYAEELDITDKMYYVYPKFGNLVSASVPAGIFLSEQENLVKRDDVLAGWVGSAGMSFAAFTFQY